MSGGVDSSVSALMLKQQGFDVQGIFMKNWDEDDGTEFCTAITDYEDAQRVADKLQIPLHAINFASEYWDDVFEEFLLEYRAGRTPNPDVLCNKSIKFAVFQDYAEMHGFELVATGHYARMNLNQEPAKLYRASDLNKDQTYFLQAVPLDRLKRCLFPLGEFSKDEVRACARDQGLHVHDKKDSTGICFIGERRFAEFLSRYVSQNPGPIQDMQGRIIGEHIGLPFYTLGQRQGLRIGGRRNARDVPWYVQAKDSEQNTLTVTQEQHDLESDSLVASELNLLTTDLNDLQRCEGMIRYRAKPERCQTSFVDDKLNVKFERAQRAITPGQYIAFYQGERCLGGAKIQETLS